MVWHVPCGISHGGNSSSSSSTHTTACGTRCGQTDQYTVRLANGYLTGHVAIVLRKLSCISFVVAQRVDADGVNSCFQQMVLSVLPCWLCLLALGACFDYVMPAWSIGSCQCNLLMCTADRVGAFLLYYGR
jgi:hypothetical protein